MREGAFVTLFGRIFLLFGGGSQRRRLLRSFLWAKGGAFWGRVALEILRIRYAFILVILYACFDSHICMIVPYIY